MPADRAPLSDDDDLPEPPRLRALRRLVTALTATLILGVVAVAAALVIRVANVAPPAPAPFAPATLAAERIEIPAGETLAAVGASGGALLLATRDEAGRERLRVFSAEDGAALGVVEIDRAAP